MPNFAVATISGRGRRRRTLLAVSRRRQRGTTGSHRWFIHRSSDERGRCVELRSPRISASSGALRPAELFISRSADQRLRSGRIGRIVRATKRRKQRGAPDCRLPPRPRRWHVGAGLSDRPACLLVLPAAVARQAARWKGEVRTRMAGPHRLRRAIAVLVPDLPDEECGFRLRRPRDAFGDRAYLALTLRHRPNDQLRLLSCRTAAQMRCDRVTNGVIFHDPPAASFGTSSPAFGAASRRYNQRPQGVAPIGTSSLRGDAVYSAATHLASHRSPTVPLQPRRAGYQYRGTRRSGSHRRDAGEASRKVPRAYPEGVPTVTAALQHELRLIEKLDYAPYFLTVNSIVRFARSKDILPGARLGG